MKKFFLAIKLLFIYVRALLIAHLHYDIDFFKDSKYFKGGKYGRFTANGWQWVIDDYKACRRSKINENVRWPVSDKIKIVCPENIKFHADDLNNFQSFGIYIQAIGKITIGHGSYIAPNVGLITANHDFMDLENHTKAKPINIGERCWIGMNSVILPGVNLADGTVVGAGSVVTKSFEEKNCVIAGNPAKIIKKYQLKA